MNKQFLKLVENDVYAVAKRIRQIDDSYRIYYNVLTGKYEVHSQENKKKDTYCFTVQYDVLDDRTLEKCRKTNVSLHGNKIYKEIKENNRILDERNERYHRNTIEDASREAAIDISLAVEQDELHSGYRRTVQI